MGDRIQILGVSVDRIKLDKVLNLTNIYLNNDCVNIIYFAGSKTSLKAEDDEAFAAFVDMADLVVAGDSNIENEVFGNEFFQDKKLIVNKYMERLFQKLNRNRKSIYLLNNSDGKLKRLMEVLRSNYPDLTCAGSEYQETMPEEAVNSLVNGINIIAPDVLLLLMESELIEEFLENNRTKINVKLCICMDEITGDASDGTLLMAIVPEWVSRMHLTLLYQRVFQRKNLHTTIMNRIFHRKMKQKNNERNHDDGGNET